MQTDILGLINGVGVRRTILVKAWMTSPGIQGIALDLKLRYQPHFSGGILILFLWVFGLNNNINNNNNNYRKKTNKHNTLFHTLFFFPPKMSSSLYL